MRDIVLENYNDVTHNLFVKNENGNVLEYVYLPKAKFVRFADANGGCSYIIRNYYYNIDYDLFIEITKADQSYERPNKEKYGGPYSTKKSTLEELIKTVRPAYNFLGDTNVKQPILVQSTIMKHCFRLRRISSFLKQSFNDLPTVLMAILEYKAEKYGISLTVNYKSYKEYPIKCNSEEDLAMFLMYFQNFL
jgi:hypothetical protein